MIRPKWRQTKQVRSFSHHFFLYLTTRYIDFCKNNCNDASISSAPFYRGPRVVGTRAQIDRRSTSRSLAQSYKKRHLQSLILRRSDPCKIKGKFVEASFLYLSKKENYRKAESARPKKKELQRVSRLLNTIDSPQQS